MGNVWIWALVLIVGFIAYSEGKDAGIEATRAARPRLPAIYKGVLELTEDTVREALDDCNVYAEISGTEINGFYDCRSGGSEEVKAIKEALGKCPFYLDKSLHGEHYCR